jgi:hypothetical protein
VRGWCSCPPALGALAPGRPIFLLCCCHLEQHLQLLSHSSLLGGRRLRAAAQQHGRSGKVMRCLPEEWRCVSIGVRVDVHALIGASVVVACQHTCRWCWCAVVRLVGSWTALKSIVVLLTGLLLHRDVLCRQSVARLVIHAKLLVKKGQLLVELALASASSSSRARYWASAVGWRRADSGLELLDAEATQTLHSCVGLCRRVVRALQVVVDPRAAPRGGR